MSSLSSRPALPWARFGPILAIQFLGTLGFSLAMPFLVFIVSDLGGASWTYGLVGATYSVFQFFGASLLGRWSDRTGRRPVLLASQVGSLAAWLLLLVALRMPRVDLAHLAGASLTIPLLLVFVARALDGSTGGDASVANAYVADLTRDTPGLRQMAFGRMGMAANLGFVVGPAAAGLLGGTAWGPRLPIAAAAVLSAVTTLAIVVLLDEPEGRCPQGPPMPEVIEAELHQQARPCNTAPVAGALRKTIVRGPVAIILAATFLIFLGFNVFYAAFPVHAAEAFEWSAGELGGFFAVLSGMMVVGQGPLLTVASKHLRPTAVFAVGMGFLVVAFVSLRMPAGPFSILAAACFAVGNALSWPTFQARVAEVGGDDQGAVQGAVTSASSLASVGGLVLGGLLYPVLGGALFVVAAGLFGLVLALTPLWFRAG